MVQAMEQTRRFRIPFKPVLLLIVVAAVAANVPKSWIYGQTPEQRRAEVFSDFVNLSAEPGQGELAFLQSWASISGQARRARKDRMEHVHPEVIAAYAARMEVSDESLRERMISPDITTPFDLATMNVSQPDFIQHAEVGKWSWGVAKDVAQRTPDDTSGELGCGVWFVFWDTEDWFYAPIGTVEADQLLVDSVPGVGRLPFMDLPRCDANE